MHHGQNMVWSWFPGFIIQPFNFNLIFIIVLYCYI